MTLRKHPRFFAEDGGTRVELEHRYLERYGAAAEAVRASLDAPGGWQGGLDRFATAMDGRSPAKKRSAAGGPRRFAEKNERFSGPTHP